MNRRAPGDRGLRIWTGILLVLLAAAGISVYLLLPRELPPPVTPTSGERTAELSPDGMPLPVYDAIIDHLDADPRPVVVGIMYPVAATAEGRFRELVDTLTTREHLPGAIRLTGFDRDADGLVANVELVAQGASLSDDPWYQSFQGSTGAWATEQLVVWNLLQPHYAGGWPDGVRLSWRGNPIPELDHIDLSGTLLRSDALLTHPRREP